MTQRDKGFHVMDKGTNKVRFRTNYMVIALLAAIYLTIRDAIQNKFSRNKI